MNELDARGHQLTIEPTIGDEIKAVLGLHMQKQLHNTLPPKILQFPLTR